MTPENKHTLFQELLELLTLEPLEENFFRGQSLDHGWGHIFGGQLLGQALVAANHTVEGRSPHSLHGYFLRSGDVKKPILYKIDRIRDGGSFTVRRVVAIQDGTELFNLLVSYHIQEESFEHQTEMPEVPGPENLIHEIEHRKRFVDKFPEKFHAYYLHKLPIDIKPIEPWDPTIPQERKPLKRSWLKTFEALPGDSLHHHQSILAYASDFGLIATAMMPHKLTLLDRRLSRVTSLDHAMWFHRPFRIDDWLLYDMESPTFFGARALVRGQFFNKEGKLVASVAQEGLIRTRSST
ncbi:acyl-CoA thioesterase II [Deltaproteobacteria bacterium TL4]